MYWFVCLFMYLPHQNVSFLRVEALIFYLLLYSKVYIEHLIQEYGQW